MLPKLLVGVLSLFGGVSAQFAPTPCPLPNNQNAECNNNEVCTQVPSDRNLDYCLELGNDECLRHQFLGTDGNVVAVVAGGIIPSDTCCDGAVCTWGQSCVNRVSGTFEYDGQQYDAEVLARNDWKLPNGEKIQNRPRVCSNTGVMLGAPGTKIVFVPIVSILFLLVAFGMAYKSPGFAFRIGSIPAVLMLVTSFFLFFSEMWVWAWVATFVAAVALVVPNQNVLGYYLLFQVTLLWLYLGSSALVLMSAPRNLFINFQADSNDGLTIMQSIADSCGDYYNGYFNYAAATRPWSVSGSRLTWGYCSFEWLGLEIVMSVTQFAAFSLVVLQTTFAWLGSGGAKDGPSSSV